MACLVHPFKAPLSLYPNSTSERISFTLGTYSLLVPIPLQIFFHVCHLNHLHLLRSFYVPLIFSSFSNSLGFILSNQISECRGANLVH